MNVDLEDLTEASLVWTEATDPPAAFAEWLYAQPERLQIGFAMLGVRPPLGAFTDEIRRVAANAASIRALVTDDRWRDALAEGVRRSIELIAQPPRCSISVLVGIGRSNASAAYWRGEGRAFIWLESWLESWLGRGAHSGLQDLDTSELGLSVAHELGHAFRAAIPGTAAAEARRLDGVERVWDAWDVRLRGSLDEVMFEEGLATAFSQAAYADADPARVLFMDPEAVTWLDAHWEALLDERRWRWQQRPTETLGQLTDALFVDPRRTPPWTIEQPPSKWGYYVGLRWAHKAMRATWKETLAAARPST